MRHLHPVAHGVRKHKNSIERLNRAAFEALEDRRLLATITGVVFDDLNRDGAHDAGEPERANQLIYIDANGNGQFDSALATYASVENPPKEIQDDNETSFPLEIAGTGTTIADVDVTLDITHPYTADLQVFLIAPDGTSVELFSSLSGENFTNTVLDDEATMEIGDGASPYNGSFRPVESLSAFDGKSADGIWQLRIIDGFPEDAGFLNRWSLTIDGGGASEKSTVTDAVGIYQLTDLEAGTYVVRDVLPPNRIHSTPPDGVATVPVTADETAIVNFGSYRPAFENAGLLDATFGVEGVLTFPTTGVQQGGEALAVQSDGKLIVGGWIVEETDGDRKFLLARLNTDGTLDGTFGGGAGYVVTDFTTGDDEVRDVVIQGDGKIIAAGRTNGNSGDFAFARYNPDGTPDTTFSGDGKVTVDMNVGLNRGDVVTGLALQDDGKIVATGTVSSQASTDFGTVRLNADGTIDATFAGTGRSIIDFIGGIDAASDVTVDQDGNIVVVGGAIPFATGSGGYQRWVMLRYKPDGQLDATFDGGKGSSGRVTHDFQAAAIAKTIAPLPNGKYLIGGLIDGAWTVARFNNDGSLDASFGTGGKTSVPALRGDALADYGMAVQRDGKIVLGGRHETDEGATTFAVARFLADGTLDENFGFDGVMITDIDGSASGSDLVLQQDDKILLVGGDGALTLVRYLNDVPEGPTFAVLESGILTLTGTDENDAFVLSQAGGEYTVVFGTESMTFNTADVSGLLLNGLDGDDTLTIDMAGGNVGLASLTIAAGNGDDRIVLSNGDGKLLTMGASPALNGEHLDLGTAEMKITGANVSDVEPLLASARNGGETRWAGPGIGTSAADEFTGLVSVQQGADVLVKYSYNGDANGDGEVNADDYFRIDSNFIAQPANPLYAQGDFNFDDQINADDYFLIDSAFIGQGAPLAAQQTAPAALSASLSATAADAATSFTVASEEETSRKKPVRRSDGGDSLLEQRSPRRATAGRRGR